MADNLLTNFQYSRIQQRYTTVPSVVPTIPVLTGATMTGYTEADNMVLGNFTSTDLLDTEIFVNTYDDRVFIRSNDKILEFITSGGTLDNINTTGGTWNPVTNILTYTKTDGSSYSVYIDSFSGLTVNGLLSATTIDANTILSGGTDISTLFAPTLTNGNGTTASGNKINLGGILNQTTTISGASQNFYLGTTTSTLTTFDLNAIQGTTKYSVPGQGITILTNPGGQSTTLTTPTINSKYELNPAYFNVDYSGTTDQSTFRVYQNQINSNTTDYYVSSDNFVVQPTNGLITADAAGDIVTKYWDQNTTIDTVSGASSSAIFTTTEAAADRVLTNGTATSKVNATVDNVTIEVSDTTTDLKNTTLITEDEHQVTVQHTGTTQQSYIESRYNTLTLRHEDSGTTYNQLFMGDVNATFNMDNGTNNAGLTISPTTTSLFVSGKVSLDFSTTDATFTDLRSGAAAVGLEYAADYSANYTPLSLITKQDLDAATSGSTGGGYWSGSTGSLSLVPINQTGNVAYGLAGLAGGALTTSSGQTSFAYGTQVSAIGPYSVAFGSASVASGEGAVAFGTGNNTASGNNSIVQGGNNFASGNNSAAFGAQTIASGNQSFAAGSSSTASGTASAAFNSSTASGIGSAAFNSSTAIGNNSFSIGGSNVAYATSSFAGGAYSQASGSTSFVHSYQGFAKAENSAILGGSGNTLETTAINSVILGCHDITGSAPNTVYACNIDAGTFYSGGTNLLDIFSTNGVNSNKYVTTSGFTSFVPITINHNLNTTTPIVQVIDSTGNLIIPHSISGYTLNSVDVTVSPTDTYTVIVDGGGASTGNLQSPYDSSRLTVGTGYTFSNGTNTIVVATNNTTTINLPASPSIDKFYIVKCRQNASLYPITVNGNGNNIDGDTSLLINTNTNASYLFVYDGTEYIVV